MQPGKIFRSDAGISNLEFGEKNQLPDSKALFWEVRNGDLADFQHDSWQQLPRLSESFSRPTL